MSSATTELVSADDDGNMTSDIQNYLQSFNKEIGEVGAGDGQSNSAGTTFYIDASQVCTAMCGHVYLMSFFAAW